MIRERGYHSTVVSSQGASAGECRATIVVDGMRVLGDDPIINDVSPFEIGAIEAYPQVWLFMRRRRSITSAGAAGS